MKVPFMYALMTGATLAGTAAAAFPDAARQPTHVRLTGTPVTTAISGFAGTARDVPLRDQEAVKYIRWWERRDNPCHIEVSGRHVRYDQFPRIQNVGDWCGGFSGDAAEVGFMNISNQNFVSGLRVCTNRDGTRIKGIQVRGRSVSVTGEVGESTTVPEPEERANCHTWRRWVNCPEDYIATGIVAHLEAGTPPRSIVGIALQCRRVAASTD